MNEETARQKFIRNSGESVRTMRTAAVAEERAGNADNARRIHAIADQWDRIGKIAEREEAEGKP